MTEIIITKDNFESEVVNSSVPVVLDFWATWCGPCRMLSPVISEIADEYEGKIKVGKINVDKEEELAVSFNVMSIPMVVIMQNGKVSETFVGFRNKEFFDEIINKYI